MSTTPTPSPAPPTSKVGNILMIIDMGLKGLAMVPGVGAIPGLADIFLHIIQGGMAAYQAETGMPLDLTKIPQEDLVP